MDEGPAKTQSGEQEQKPGQTPPGVGPGELLYFPEEIYEAGVFSEMHSPYFRPWMRRVALFICAIFIYHDAAWAANFNFANLSRPDFQVRPLAAQDLKPKVFNEAVAGAVNDFLRHVEKNKSSGPARINNTTPLDVNINLKKDFRESVLVWLKDPRTETVPCSAYVVYNLLRALRVPAASKKSPASCSSRIF